MGRSSLVVDIKQLQSQLTQLEESRTFSNHTDLFQALSETSWSKDIRNEKHAVRGASPQFLQAKVREFGLIVKTPVGKRGKVVGGVRVSRGSKLSKIPRAVQSLARIRKQIPQEYSKAVDQLESGSIKAAVRLKCLECHGFTGAHRACDCSGCPLFPINLLMWPNRKVLVEDEDKFFKVVTDKSQQNA